MQEACDGTRQLSRIVLEPENCQRRLSCVLIRQATTALWKVFLPPPPSCAFKQLLELHNPERTKKKKKRDQRQRETDRGIEREKWYRTSPLPWYNRQKHTLSHTYLILVVAWISIHVRANILFCSFRVSLPMWSHQVCNDETPPRLRCIITGQRGSRRRERMSVKCIRARMWACLRGSACGPSMPSCRRMWVRIVEGSLGESGKGVADGILSPSSHEGTLTCVRNTTFTFICIRKKGSWGTVLRRHPGHADETESVVHSVKLAKSLRSHSFYKMVNGVIRNHILWCLIRPKTHYPDALLHTYFIRSCH